MQTRPKQPLVLVTGASGLIGAQNADRLVNDYRVIGSGFPHPPPSTDNVPCDISSDVSVKNSLASIRTKYGSHLTSVIHLAAYFDFSGEPESSGSADGSYRRKPGGVLCFLRTNVEACS
jgi:nucleoside-diphosphate-sugar epimerase